MSAIPPVDRTGPVLPSSPREHPQYPGPGDGLIRRDQRGGRNPRERRRAPQGDTGPSDGPGGRHIVDTFAGARAWRSHRAVGTSQQGCRV